MSKAMGIPARPSAPEIQRPNFGLYDLGSIPLAISVVFANWCATALLRRGDFDGAWFGMVTEPASFLFVLAGAAFAIRILYRRIGDRRANRIGTAFALCCCVMLLAGALFAMFKAPTLLEPVEVSWSVYPIGVFCGGIVGAAWALVTAPFSLLPAWLTVCALQRLGVGDE